jgi:hypothetical protein
MKQKGCHRLLYRFLFFCLASKISINEWLSTIHSSNLDSSCIIPKQYVTYKERKDNVQAIYIWLYIYGRSLIEVTEP